LKNGVWKLQKKSVFLPAGKIKCHNSCFAHEMFMKKKTVIFYFYAKQRKSSWTNTSKMSRIIFAKHPAKVFAL